MNEVVAFGVRHSLGVILPSPCPRNGNAVDGILLFFVLVVPHSDNTFSVGSQKFFIISLVIHKEYLKMTGKKVSFSDVTIREYGYEIGDHPCCSDGAPVTLSWKAGAEYTQDLGMYEYTRTRYRRTKHPFKLSMNERTEILLSAGYSLNEITAASIQVEYIKKMRSDTRRSSSGFVDRTKSVLETTSKLPKDVFMGMTGFLTVKATKATIAAARSA
jgi:hypothetical protein